MNPAGRTRTHDGWCDDPAAPGRIVLPAMPDLHCHAFQRAMAGLAESRQEAEDSFWSWRRLMYRSLDRLDPDTMLAIATQLYVELVRNGYARVCEFHYVHNAPDGRPYADPTAMADALVEAARTAGIGLTLLPVLYAASDFGGKAPEPGQRRFILSTDAYLAMVETLAARAPREGFTVGTAFHSLRAVTPDMMHDVLAACPHSPVHIHAAEQEREVDASIAHHGARPVEWLLAEMPVDRRWTLVHATHMTDAEATALARSGATVALCPTTEANLGDGLFNADAYFNAGGRFGIGSDSNVCTDPAEELRLLEYGRRLARRRRVLGRDDATPSSGAWSWLAAARQPDATGVQSDDRIVLDTAQPVLAAAEGDAAIDALVFGGRAFVEETWVAGRRITMDGRHPEEERAAAAYRAALARLKESV